MKLSILIPNHNEKNILDMLELTINLFPEAQVIICNDRDGKGKGWAVREALTQATGDFICFIDGDLDISPRMLRRLLPFISDYDIVVGMKNVRRTLFRRLLTKSSRIYSKLKFGLDIDTQTGIKLFRRSALLDWKSNSFFFDIEILKKAKDFGKSIIAVPVEVSDFGSSSKPMKLINVWRAFVESWKV